MRAQLDKSVQARGNVEVWLGDLLTMQQSSLHSVIREANMLINEPNFDLLPFLRDFIAQVTRRGLGQAAYTCRAAICSVVMYISII